jgi:hypothetical protein
MGDALPTVTTIRVIPVAGYDSFLLNLSGGHGPVFTRNLVVLEDNAGPPASARPRAAKPSARRSRPRPNSSSADASAK